MSEVVISPGLLALLRCPLTLQPLRVADAALLARLPAGVDAALVRADDAVAYPVRDGLPRLVAEEAIAVAPSAL